MNISIITQPTGRSPENKWFFGERTSALDLTRPKYNKIGREQDFQWFYAQMQDVDYKHNLVFYTCGKCFRVETTDVRHAQFVRNMFTVVDNPHDHCADWVIFHSPTSSTEPKIYVHLDDHVMLIAGTTFLGEIKKGVFGILSFELPTLDALPMHCSAFTYQHNGGTKTNLMFGLSGTGKTTLSSDPEYRLISDDEVAWTSDSVQMIETGCYAKSEGLSVETHPTIFNAVELARSQDRLVEENPGASNARLSYPLSTVENAYDYDDDLRHPHNIFFLTMDAKGLFPPVSKITGETIKRFFETGYTSQMPGTEAGDNQIKPLFSPCYGSPFMPLDISVYSDMLMEMIRIHKVNVYLINTGMDSDGVRYSLDFTRECVKLAIQSGFGLAANEGAPDNSDVCLNILEELINGS